MPSQSAARPAVLRHAQPACALPSRSASCPAVVDLIDAEFPPTHGRKLGIHFEQYTREGCHDTLKPAILNYA
jgi:hypothetical protein